MFKRESIQFFKLSRAEDYDSQLFKKSLGISLIDSWQRK
jgi:hypothetical protein